MADIKAFNSEEYGWVDIQIVALGRPMAGATGIRFKEMQEKKNVRGAGRKPVARHRGGIDYEGTLRILMSELVALLQSQGNNRGVTQIPPFDIIVAFAPSIGDTITTFRLVYTEFTECEVNVNRDDEEILIELPLIIGDIEWNI